MRAGDIWRASGRPELAERLWNMAGDMPQTRAAAAARKGFMAKRAGDFETARREFLRALDAAGGGGTQCAGISAYSLLEELAKLEEHRFKSPALAAEHARQALEWLRKNRYLLGKSFAEMNRSMTRRAERLEKILEKKNKTILIKEEETD
jgi:tetratricopeptide (TPR) repeat protein